MELAAKVLHGLAATDSIVGGADKITGLFAPFVSYTRHGSRINGCCLFQLERIQHDLQADPHCQDHRPEITLAAIVATTFIEPGKRGTQLLLMEPKKVI